MKFPSLFLKKRMPLHSSQLVILFSSYLDNLTLEPAVVVVDAFVFVCSVFLDDQKMLKGYAEEME